MISGSDKIENF